MLRSCTLVLERLSSRMLRACCWVCVALVPVGLAAQEGSSLLSLLPTEGRAVSVGQEVHGELRASDHVDHRGNHLQAWEIRGDAGRSVVVDLVSQPLDPYLFVVGPGLGEGLSDDDGGSDLNSRLCVEFPASGSYRIVASALRGATGAYTLRVRTAEADEGCDEQGQWQSGPEVALEEMSFTGTLTLDRAVEGSFGSQDPVFRGSFVQAWALEGRAGQTVAIDLTSEELDTYLFVLGPGLDLLSDDDGGDGYDSRLCVELPETGTYRIVASTFGDESPGPYRLLASADPGPGEPGACDSYEVSMDVFLPELPVAGRTLRVGAVASSELDRGDAQDPSDGSYMEAWSLRLEAGQEVAVDMVSQEFDTYLFLLGPGIDGFDRNDDGAGACNARLSFTAPETGTYRVVASSFGSGTTGRYELHVTSEPGPEHDGPCPGDTGMNMELGLGSRGADAADLAALPVVGALSPGYGHQGTLTSDDPVLDDSYAHAWELRGTAGEALTVELISDDFDSYLYLTGPGLDVLSDDDGAGSLDSRIEVTFPETGTYRVVATTFDDFGTGAYRLRTIRTR